MDGVRSGRQYRRSARRRRGPNAALSIRQPWASLIINHGKDIENRGWSTRVRAESRARRQRLLADRNYRMAHREHDARASSRRRTGVDPTRRVHRHRRLSTALTDSDTPPVHGPFGFVLRDPQPIDFVPWRGQLGFFDVPWPLPAREKSDADR